MLNLCSKVTQLYSHKLSFQALFSVMAYEAIESGFLGYTWDPLVYPF